MANIDFSFLARGVTAKQPLDALGEGLMSGINAGLTIQQSRNASEKHDMEVAEFERLKEEQNKINEILSKPDASDKLLQGEAGIEGFKVGNQLKNKELEEARLNLSEDQFKDLKASRKFNQDLDLKDLNNDPDFKKLQVLSESQRDAAIVLDPNMQKFFTKEEADAADKRHNARISNNGRTVRLLRSNPPNDTQRESIMIDLTKMEVTSKDGGTATPFAENEVSKEDTLTIVNNVGAIVNGIIATNAPKGVRKDYSGTSAAVLKYLSSSLVDSDPLPLLGTAGIPDFKLDPVEYSRRLELLSKSPEELQALVASKQLDKGEAIEILRIIGDFN